MRIHRKVWRLVSLLAVLLGTLLTASAQNSPPAAAPSAASTVADARAQAYYHFTLAHMYDEMAELFRRSDYQRRAIEEYKEALKYDPGSAQLVVELADAYRRGGRIREAVLEARQLLETDPDNLAAHRLLGHIYLQTLGELQPGAPAEPQQTLPLAIEEFEHITRLAPGDTEALLNLARLYRMNNDLAQAEAALKKLLGVEPQSETALAALALLYSDRGQYQKAIDLLQEAAAGSPSGKLLASLAYAYEQANDFDNAIQTYRRAFEQDEDNLELRRRLAESLVRADRLEEALSEYRALAEVDPEDPQTQLRLSQVYRHLGRFPEARAALEKAKQLAPDSLEMAFNESFLYEAQGDFRGAIAVLSEMVARMTQASADYDEQERHSRSIVLERLGTLHRQTEAYEEAVQVFELLLPLGEEEARRGYAQIIETQRQARQFDAAVARARQGLERFPEDADLKLQLATLLGDRGELERGVELARSLLDASPADRQIYLALAQIYERNKRFPEAEAAVAEAEKLSQPGVEMEYVHFLRGALYERQKKYDLAEEQFRKVLAMNPESAVTLNYLGYMFADQGMKLEESVELLERAVKIEPYNGAYLDSLGWAYFRLNQLGKAEEYLRRAVERISRDPTIHDHLGDLYYKLGRLDLAEKAWERSREEWERTPKTEFDSDAFARLEAKLRDLKSRLAQETQTKPPK
ncbi:MAG: tetratricopeptide repeat protein [Acidobacteria bacterium]|nr:tetratricopeptide repeat protein [Acidobacteriota bacterium]